jgi:threonine synthase
MFSKFKCIECGKTYPAENRFRCDCGGLLDVVHKFEDVDRSLFNYRLGSLKKPYNSGVWRFKEIVNPSIDDLYIVSRSEGNTNQYTHPKLSEYVGLKNLITKHEGENPTGSFKDRGMTVGISEARKLGAKSVVCASTGNTSASLAAYAAQAGLDCVVFIPEGEITFGKLAQALSYGARVLQISGNFDDAMRIVQEVSNELGLYLLNSVNPWRIEGQKTIIFEMLQQRGWSPPNWIIVPAGNLGNTSAFGKAILEAEALGLIDEVPHVASIQAQGANPFYSLWKRGGESLEPMKPVTVASAIKIGNPLSWKKARRSIEETGGLVEEVSDQEIMDAKAIVDRSGIGCEPASAASVAGVRKLVEAGSIDSNEDVVCVLTGNLLKDTNASIDYHTGRIDGVKPRFANFPEVIEADLESVERALTGLSQKKWRA